MSTIRKILTPLLDRRATEITRLRAELAAAQARIVVLEEALEKATWRAR